MDDHQQLQILRPQGGSHQHRLVERDFIWSLQHIISRDPSLTILCRICNGPVFDLFFYSCELCQYFVHTTCNVLPRVINHPFHPSHPLSLLTEGHGNFMCDSCHQICYTNPCFRCDQCDLHMDGRCALIPPITWEDFSFQDQEHIQHFTHQHPMVLVEIKDGEDEIKCFACYLTLSDRAYGCRICGYYLHKSCAELRREIDRHPLHLPHPLFLCVSHNYLTRCKLCYKGPLIFYFECRQCSFHLCVICATTTRREPIKFKSHEHPLYFLERIYTNLVQCDGYDSYCNQPILSKSTELQNHNSSSIFCCADCSFKVHLLCGPLPSTIKHECHIHPLNLIDSIIEDDYGEYYCDVCETERDPRICVYFCEECKHVAHVYCVAPEIINVLRGDIRDVKIRTVGEDTWKLPEEIGNAMMRDKEQGKTVLTLKDLIENVTEDELGHLRSKFYWDEGNKGRQQEVIPWMSQIDFGILGDESVDELLQISHYTETEFNNYVEHYGVYDRKLKISSDDLALKVVNVQNYLIPTKLAPIMKYILHNYGDISEKSISSKAMKSITYFFLCRVVKKMRTTLFVDISREALQDWHFYVEFARFWAHFDVDFLEASLEEITRSVLYLRLSKIEVEGPIEINEKMTDLQEKMVELQRKMEEQRAKLEECKKVFKSSSTPEFMKEGLNKAMKLKWKSVGEVLMF